MPNIQFLIANPAAGSGRTRHLLPLVRKQVLALGNAPQIWQTRNAAEARCLAESVPPGKDVAVLGGDGTINAVINGLRNKDCRILMLPSGSGNDLARSLGLLRDPLSVVASASWKELSIDLGEIGGHLFANNAGVGLDGEVCRLIQNCDWAFMGRFGYVRATMSCALNLRSTTICLTVDGATFQDQMLMVTFANGEFYGKGMRIAPGARLDDGLLEICSVLKVDRLTLLTVFPSVYAGIHVHHPAFRLSRARSLTLTGERPLSLHADGEVVGRLSTSPAQPTHVRIAATRQRFLVPG